MDNQKKQMAEAAVLYYEKKYTQQEIAKLMDLSRQTVSKLLNDAIKENIVEIKIHDPEQDCREAEENIKEKFGIDDAVVCSVGSRNESVRTMMTVRKAVCHILPLIKTGNMKIAVSWGKTIQAFIDGLPDTDTDGNIVFPLFGATDMEGSCFSSNELARCFAEKINGEFKGAWFPYMLSSSYDCNVFKKTSYYQNIKELWNNIDLAVVGIGNKTTRKLFEKTFGYGERNETVAGDVSTHFFTAEGRITGPYENTLCASPEDIINAKRTVAVACGNEKAEAIAGALRSGLINTIITDEYTAKKVLEK